MPPVNQQQGSRAALIVTMVLSIIVAIVFLLTTYYFNSQYQQDHKLVTELQKKYAGAIADDKLGPEGEFNAQRQNEMKTELAVTGTATVTDLLQMKTDKVTAAVSGATEPYTATIQKLQDVVATASKAAPSAKVASTDTVLAAIPKLTKEVNTQMAAVAAATTARDKSAADLTAAQASLKAQLDALNTATKAADEKVAAAEAAKAEAIKAYTEASSKAGEDSKKAIDEAGKSVQEAIVKIQDAEAKRDAAYKQLAAIKPRLELKRFDTTKHMIDAAVDGEIIRLGTGNVVYINLGSGDHLPPGLTFEVYDKNTGIPNSTTDRVSDVNLPAGKASIEVVRIGQNSSECRVVHSAAGATIAQGDIIANLVYDRNTTYHFFVYGEFDVDQNGVFSAQEGDVIKSLVTRWGGKVDDKISISTDFIILGREPKVPQLTQEEIQNDALLLAKKNAAEAALKAYQDIIFAGGDLRIPIMNQNRFLYYVGYYDQAKR